MPYGELTIPTREGYTFMGWSTNSGIEYILPSEYQEVEYIESTGTQYINTGVVPNVNLDGEVVLLAVQFGFPFGSTNGQNRDYWGINFYNSGQYELYYGTGSYPKINSWQLNTKYTIKIEDKKFYSNDVLLYDFNSGSNSFTFNTSKPIYLFALNYNGVSYSKFKIYSVKLLQNNILIRNFVSCYRNTDGEIGMYDTVNNEFYTNQGSGTFLKGENVYNSVTSSTIVTNSDNHTLYAIWQKNPIVTFNANGGNVNTNQKEVIYGKKYGELPIPTREGYTFIGWNGKNIFNKNEMINAAGGGTVIINNKIFFDGSATLNNTASYVVVQKYNNGSYVGDFGSSSVSLSSSAIGPHSYAFTKDSSFDRLLIKLNTSRLDPYIYLNNVGNFIENVQYTISYNLDSYDTSKAQCTISNLQLEQGSVATPYEPYFIESNTMVVQNQNHTLKAIWEPNS